MATTAQWYPQSGGNLIARLWVPQQMGVVLLGASYPAALDTDLRYADVAAYQVPAGGGYATGGKEIMNRSASYDAAADEWTLLGDDVVWGPGASFSVRYAAVYEMATTDKYLWEFLDFGQLYTVENGYFAVDFISGVLGIKAAAPV